MSSRVHKLRAAGSHWMERALQLEEEVRSANSKIRGLEREVRRAEDALREANRRVLDMTDEVYQYRIVSSGGHPGARYAGAIRSDVTYYNVNEQVPDAPQIAHMMVKIAMERLLPELGKLFGRQPRVEVSNVEREDVLV